MVELLYLDEIPPKVTINEYVELSHQFGTDESPGFVNGVLDAVRRDRLDGAGEGEGCC